MEKLNRDEVLKESFLKGGIDTLKLNSSFQDIAFHNQNLLRIFIKKWNCWSNKP